MEPSIDFSWEMEKAKAKGKCISKISNPLTNLKRFRAIFCGASEPFVFVRVKHKR